MTECKDAIAASVLEIVSWEPQIKNFIALPQKKSSLIVEDALSPRKDQPEVGAFEMGNIGVRKLVVYKPNGVLRESRCGALSRMGWERCYQIPISDEISGKHLHH